MDNRQSKNQDLCNTITKTKNIHDIKEGTKLPINLRRSWYDNKI